MHLRLQEKTFVMTKKLMGLVAGIAVIGSSATLFAQEGTKPANVGEGTVMVKGKNYPLKNAAAYETTVDGEEGIAVVLSGPTISSEKLNAARKSEKAGEIPDFRKPYVKLEFTKAGDFKGWGAGAGDISLGRHTSNATLNSSCRTAGPLAKPTSRMKPRECFPRAWTFVSMCRCYVRENRCRHPKSRAPPPM